MRRAIDDTNETDNQAWLEEVRYLRSEVLRKYKRYLNKEAATPEEVHDLGRAIGMPMSYMTIYHEAHCSAEVEKKLRLLNGPYSHAIFKALFLKQRGEHE